MKKKIRLASLLMLIIAIIWIVIAFLTMDVPINLPSYVFSTLKVIYTIYPIIMIGLFIISFFIKEK